MTGCFKDILQAVLVEFNKRNLIHIKLFHIQELYMSLVSRELSLEKCPQQPPLQTDFARSLSKCGQKLKQEAKKVGDDRLINPIKHGGGGMMAPQNVFDHYVQTLRRRKLKLGDF